MSENQAKKQTLNVSAKSFIAAIAVVLALMVGTYALSFIIPGGEFLRITDEAGNTIISPEAEFTYVEGGIPFWKWLLSPILVLGAEGGGLVAAILAFLLVIGGVFQTLDTRGLMSYMLGKMVARFGSRRYSMLCLLALFFMGMGAFIGSFEECIPLVPIVVALAIKLGWDDLTGLGTSLLAVGCGFASGVCNPFTVGVAQSLAGLPMFSGVWLRLVAFVFIYALLIMFLIKHAKKVDRGVDAEAMSHDFTADALLDKGLFWFALIVGCGIVLVLCSGFLSFLQDYTMIIVAVMFLAAGLCSTLVSRMDKGELLRSFGKGVVGILPAVVLILMASSVKYTLTEARILDTLLHWAVDMAGGKPAWLILLFIYLIVLVMNFFISSGSAKAFLLIPLIVPMAQLFGLPEQLCIVAFAFGDGFSNVFYPTNAALLIALSLSGVSYGRWVGYSWTFQLANLLLTSMILLFGFAVGYC